MKREGLDIGLRYLLLVLFAIGNLYIIYLIFTPLTIYPSYGILKGFYNASLTSNTLSIDSCPRIEFIDACIAGSAYYLLLILNLSTRGIKITRRIFSIFFSLALFLVLNIIRIFLLTILLVENFGLFDVTHRIFWYLISIVFVVGIWFLTVKLFKIEGIPIYSDLKFLVKAMKKEKD